MLSFVNNLYEKHHRIQDGQNLAACTCFMENALVFRQSDVHNFFMYIIRKCMYDLN